MLIQKILNDGCIKSLKETIELYPEIMTDDDIISVYYALKTNTLPLLSANEIVGWTESEIVGRGTAINVECMFNLVRDGYEWIDYPIVEQKKIVAQNIKKRLRVKKIK